MRRGENDGGSRGSGNWLGNVSGARADMRRGGHEQICNNKKCSWHGADKELKPKAGEYPGVCPKCGHAVHWGYLRREIIHG